MQQRFTAAITFPSGLRSHCEAPVSTVVRSLAERWAADAELLESHGALQAAATCRRHAGELLAVLESAEDERLTLAEASRASGYSAERLRHMLADGTIPNAGRKHAPRVRRGDLPRKPSAGRSNFDPSAAAARILGGRG
jgi:hypothetical protein